LDSASLSEIKSDIYGSRLKNSSDPLKKKTSLIFGLSAIGLNILNNGGESNENVEIWGDFLSIQ
jgi:hypothetical protein